ncbi:hypothetical protein SeMB42_g02580 [Synchytrium endobioticum]|uniref:tRNA ligase n=1 Tax=Synchytrium endobioticum TaxID=286115 RepID=A0A507DFD7_9FUNG|nr:hypothetical protein SeMB42_g02580 [Synchytrium endobioticum]
MLVSHVLNHILTPTLPSKSTLSSMPVNDFQASVNAMVKSFSALEESGRKSRKSPPVRRTRYLMNPPGIHVYSYNCLEYMYKKENCPFPTRARGLFLRNIDEPLVSVNASANEVHSKSSMNNGVSKDENKSDRQNWQIVIRGYDKFFNVNEVKSTAWAWLQSNTIGPYEVTTKENGCIIFMSAVNGHLLVTSKHATGPARDLNAKSHAQVGEAWMDRHLAQAGKSRADLAKFFEHHHVTAVFELGDDDFEEHILEYPPQRRGLFLHGINENTPEFRTWSYSQLKPFAQEFGFLIVTALTMDNLQQVKEFTDNVRTSGAYDGRAVEGFVVRSHLTAEPDKAHFFKVKYDEPYLMFREWREGTKSILKNKGSRFVPKYELSRKYFAWVDRKRHTDPALFAEYMSNKGIIAVRNAFLSEYGLPGVGAGIVAATAITTEEYKRGENTYKGEDDGAAALIDAFESAGLHSDSANGASSNRIGADKTLLLPIATIGAGKTTLGLIMGRLYGIGHIQNDNITAKKKAAAIFESTVLKEFDDHKVVYADKNNHLHQHRKGISEVFKSRYPGGRIVALNWQIDPSRVEEIVKAAIGRVEARGEHHQSLTPGKTDGYQSVIYNFTRNRDPVDPDHPFDSMIDDVVDLSFYDDPRVHLNKVCDVMGWEPPTDQAYQAAYNAAIKTPITVDKVVTNAIKKKAIKPRYYGIRLDNFDVKTVLDPLFSQRHPDQAAFWQHLVRKNRVKPQLHVTLAMTKVGAPAVFNERHGRVGALAANMIAGGAQPVRVTFSGVVWDDRAMALRVSDMPVECVNVHPHATVGTRDDKVKAVISNDVLSEAYRPDGSRKSNEKVKVLDFEKPLVIDGVVDEFFQ